MSELFERIGEMMMAAERVAVLTHMDPDADAIGSAAGLALMLEARGKEVLVPVQGLIRDVVDWLRPEEILRRAWPAEFQPDLIVVVDCSDGARIGGVVAEPLGAFPGVAVINIDHHAGNRMFGDVNWVIEGLSSTCEMMVDFARGVGWDMDERVAGYLLAGIVSDTGRFQYSSTTPATMETAAFLMAKGADLAKINQALELRMTIEGIQLWGEVMSEAALAFDGRVVWSAIRLAGYEDEAKMAGLLSREMVSFLRRQATAEMAILFKEEEAGVVRLTMRSQGAFDCGRVARHFDGGGHKAAAGGQVMGSLEEARLAVWKYLAEEMFE
ncbi:MAG TPA: bifunctional oligoribonuclease/PAP phosphatase NrnA [Anaerolineae bacterium]|nr:bifunctional oligoribonuclease/PAP phosphatase NrnA [Anaerolineae bacterium]